MVESYAKRRILSMGALCTLVLCSACTPRPSGRYLFTRGAELKPGHAQMLILQKDTDRKQLAANLAHAFQTCLLNRNVFFSGMRIEGPRQSAPGVWQIALVDPESKDNHGRDVVVMVGNPPQRVGILKALPKGVSLGSGSVTVKRIGAANRTDSVLGVTADSLAGLSPCDGIQGTGISLVGQKQQVSSPTVQPPIPQYPLPKFYPQFYR